jgi:hypothetical protein
MAQRDPERYTQGDDGLIVEKVGSWAVEKLEIVTDYVYASGGARKIFRDWRCLHRPILRGGPLAHP